MFRWLNSPAAEPVRRLPDGVRLYVLGDIHGRADLLDRAFGRIDAYRAAHPHNCDFLILVGDYVDRGPCSRDVLDLVVSRMSARRTIPLKGNHEAYMLDFLENPSALRTWRQFGGLQTLMSYGLKPSINPDEREQRELSAELAEALPLTHRNLLETLPSSVSCGDFFFTHAGVRPGIPLSQQKEADLLWIREEFLQCAKDFGKVIVHGHTPVLAPEIHSNRINIDTGAYATNQLTCIMIEGSDISVL
jgi:serine/threonine protein phosphatase 1